MKKNKKKQIKLLIKEIKFGKKCFKKYLKNSMIVKNFQKVLLILF